MDRTLILVKPDAFARGLTGEIIARFENKGLRIAALKHMTVDDELAKRHYAEHDGKPFFGELVEFITSAPLVAMVLEGEQAVVAARQVIGATNPVAGRAGLDPRRLRDRRRPEHGARLGLPRVRRARGGAVLPGAGGPPVNVRRNSRPPITAMRRPRPLEIPRGIPSGLRPCLAAPTNGISWRTSTGDPPVGQPATA